MISTQILQPALIVFTFVGLEINKIIEKDWLYLTHDRFAKCWHVLEQISHHSLRVALWNQTDQPTFCWSNRNWCWQRLISPGCSKASWDGVLYPFWKTRNIKYYTCLNTRTQRKQRHPFHWENLDSWVKPCFPKANKQNKYFDSFLDKREFSSKFNIIVFIYLFSHQPWDEWCWDSLDGPQSLTLLL